jgi:hypothetical protein
MMQLLSMLQNVKYSLLSIARKNKLNHFDEVDAFFYH